MSGTWFGLTQPFGEGHGYQHNFVGVNPAAGASHSTALDSRYRWRLVSLVFTLTTDGNAANRYVKVEYLDGTGTPIVVNAAAVVLTANSTQRYVGSMFRGNSEWATNTDVLFPICPIFMDGGGLFNITVGNIQVGDTLTLIRGVFDRFPTNLEQHPGEES